MAQKKDTVASSGAIMDSLRGQQPAAAPTVDLPEPPEDDDQDQGDVQIGAEVAVGAPAEEVVEAELVEVSPYDDRARALARAEAQSSTEVALRAHPALRYLDEQLRSQINNVSDADAVVGDIITQIMQAQTAEEVLTPPEAQHCRDLENIPLTMHGYKVQRSDYEEGAPVYAVMDVTRQDTGERVPVTSGAQQILGQCLRLAQLNAFPCNVMVVKATKRPTEKGNWPLRLAVAKGQRVTDK